MFILPTGCILKPIYCFFHRSVIHRKVDSQANSKNMLNELAVEVCTEDGAVHGAPFRPGPGADTPVLQPWLAGRCSPPHPDPVLWGVSAGKALLLTRDPHDGWRSGGLGPQRLLPISSLPDGI